MAYIDDVAREVHEKYYNRGFFYKENEEIREVCEITHASKEKAKEALAKYRHSITREEKKEAKEKQKWIKMKYQEQSKNDTDRSAKSTASNETSDTWNKFWSIATDKTVKCPRCKSTSITYTTKKLSLGRAAVGAAVAGPAGAVIGGLTSKKGYAVCLNCGKKWKI